MLEHEYVHLALVDMINRLTQKPQNTGTMQKLSKVFMSLITLEMRLFSFIPIILIMLVEPLMVTDQYMSWVNLYTSRESKLCVTSANSEHE